MKRRASIFALLSHCLLATAWAQNFPFLIRLQQEDFVNLVSNGGSIGINTAIGSSENLGITLTYQGNGQVTFPQSPELLGSTAFSIVSSSSIASGLNTGGQFSISLRFTPRRSEAVSAQLTMPFVETLQGANNSTVTSRGVLLLQFNGTAPEFVVSYIRPQEQNFIPLSNGSVVDFPITQLLESSDLIVSIANRGSGSGSLNSVSIQGDAFRILGLGLLPATIPAGSEIRFTTRFSPRAEGPSTGRLNISTVNGDLAFTLQGTGFQRTFGIEVIQNGNITPLLPGQPLNLGEALPGEVISAQILVQNTNAVAVAAPSLAIFGAGFGLSELPQNSLILQPGASFMFSLQVQVSQVGPLRGRLRIGDNTFDVLASGSGSLLRFSYSSSGSGTVNVAPNGSIFFPTASIGESRTATVTIRNAGTSEANVVNISTSDARPPFTLTNLPALPARIQPGEEISFRILFVPQFAGPVATALRIDNNLFTLAGSGTPLPDLPAYSFTIPSGNINALEQPAVGLELRNPYPLAISGVLSINAEGLTGVTDTSVRFSNGLLQAPFTIPANATRAIFASGNNTIRFQTGSVAGQINLNATFTLATGAALTDNSPSVLRLSILPQAPRILSMQAVPSASAIVIQLAGIVTSRSLTRMDIELTPTAGFDISTTRFSISLEGESLLWFRSAQSQNSGGLFTVSLPLNLSLSSNTSGAGTSNLLTAISKIQVTLNNEIGASAPVSFSLQ